MGGASSSSIPNFHVSIQTKDGKRFRMTYHDLVDHVLLLRRVINEPDLRKEGPVLDSFIHDYCTRMAQGKMKHRSQQWNLPLGTEWIWHVHRLHPLIYYKDCTSQLPAGEIVDKQARQVLNGAKYKRQLHHIQDLISSTHNNSSFAPSIDLAKAVLRQNEFLTKFRQHYLYSLNLKSMQRSDFEHMVQNCISFLKLAKTDDVIVPTFEIDLIWHTLMRYPIPYRAASLALCGFFLDHDDDIEPNILNNAYTKTAERWKGAYDSEYGRNIDRKQLKTSHFISSCAVVVHQTDGSDCGGVSVCGTTGGGGGSSCGGCDSGGGASCGESGGASCGGGGGSSCGGGGGSSCGGGGSSCGGGGGSSCGGGGSSCGGGGGD